MDDHPDPYVPSQPFAWFPEFLEIVRAGRNRTLLGTVRRTDIAKAYLRRVHAPRAGV
jgi:hypothetical protein